MRETGTNAELTSEPTRGTRWLRAVVFGAIAGMAMGVLNFTAMANDWKLEDYFWFLNLPVILLMDVARARLDLFERPDVTLLYGLLALVCYWAIIGVLLALLLCYIRGRVGIIKSIFRDPTCRRILFFGTCGGMLVGGLNCAAAGTGWQVLWGCFEVLDRPAIGLIVAARERSMFVNSLFGNPTAAFISGLAVACVYWSIIGLFVAFLLCFVRVVRKRRHAAEA